MSISIVFPGQTSQYPSMGRRVLSEMPELIKYYKKASEVLERDIYKSIFENDLKFMENKQDIQPAIFLTSFVTYEYIKRKGNIIPQYLAGHSLGEITALAASGILSFEDAVAVVNKRSEYMVEAAIECPGAMASISGLEPDKVTKYCKEVEGVSVACYNSIFQTIIGGKIEELEEAERIFLEMGAKVKRIKTIGAFHTPLMKKASEKLFNYLKCVDFMKPKIPVISNVTAKPYVRFADIKELLRLQMIKPVQWENIICFLEQEYVNQLIECGPGAVLVGFMNDRKCKLRSYCTDKCDVFSLQLDSEKQVQYKNLVNYCECAGICCKNKSSNYDSDKCKEYYEELKKMKLKKEFFYSDKDIEQIFSYMIKILTEKGYAKNEIELEIKKIRMQAGLI